MERQDKARTISQNRAIHLMFDQLSEQLNDSGLYMQKVLKESVEIQWTPEMVKSYLFKPLLYAMTGKESTKDMTGAELDKMFEVLNKHLGEKFGITIVFPSLDSLVNKNLYK